MPDRRNFLSGKRKDLYGLISLSFVSLIRVAFSIHLQSRTKYYRLYLHKYEVLNYCQPILCCKMQKGFTIVSKHACVGSN